MNILLTGAASGIGKALLESLIKDNHFVVAIDINDINIENVLSFKCDIRSKYDLDVVLNYLKLNNIYLDCIINIAGIHQMVSLVESDPDKMKKLLDINLFGTLLVNRVFHKRLNKSGKIVILSSEVAGYDPMPFNSLYNISKTALDTYAQALRQELNLVDQKVISIRPGSVLTPLNKNAINLTEELVAETTIYKKQSKHFLNLVNKFMGKPLKPEVLAHKINKIINKKHPKYIYTIHPSMGLVLLNMLPKRIQCAIIKMLLNR